MSSINMTCSNCGKSLECSITDAGKDVQCPFCEAIMRAPRLPRNPFSRPMMGLYEQLKGTEWIFPYLAQLIQVTVLSMVLALIFLLTATVGIAIQIGGVFHFLLADSTSRFKTGGFAERSAYAICAGIYLLLFIPFWLIQLPFSFLGWVWTLSRPLALSLGLVVLFGGVLFAVYPEALTQLFNEAITYLSEGAGKAYAQ